MNPHFTSPGRHHAIWKQWRRIGRGKEDVFFLEHQQAVLEACRGGYPPEQVLISYELYEQRAGFWEDLAAKLPSVDWYLVDGKRLDEVVSVPGQSGLCGVFRPSLSPLAELTRQRFILLAWEVADPGNLGTLIRAGKALGDSAFIVVGGCSPWSSKVARASAGTLITAKLAQIAPADGMAALQTLKSAGFSLLATYPEAPTALTEAAWGEQTAVLVGNETRGLPGELAQLCQPVTIPITAGVESLNVAMTATIMAWEWRRQNANGKTRY